MYHGCVRLKMSRLWRPWVNQVKAVDLPIAGSVASAPVSARELHAQLIARRANANPGLVSPTYDGATVDNWAAALLALQVGDIDPRSSTSGR